MKRVKLILVVAAMLGAAACGNPKIIPDDKLADIFHDVYLTNAYAGEGFVRQIDSLNIYEPLFAKYGYTSEDIQFTIGNFAKRKSARLSDIVDEAITRLERESRFYMRRIAIHDTIGIIAREKYATTVYSDSLIEVSRIRDTARLRIRIPVTPGIYEISYDYFFDSIDHNDPPRVDHYLVDSLGRQGHSNSRRLRRLSPERVETSLTAEGRHEFLVLDLNGYPKDMTKPALKIENLSVKRYIDEQAARDSMARSLFDYRVLDSLAAGAKTPPVNADGYIYLPEVLSAPTAPTALPAKNSDAR